MSTTAILNSVRSFLKSSHMLAEEDWLAGCVNYFMEESGCTDINEIQNQAKEQWLLNNLSDICPGSLPANLGSTPKTSLSGRYVLQINAVCDIGTPAYQQYLKLQKVNTENIEATTKFDDKIPSHRMIKLYMTDGVQELTGIEYRPMRNLSLDITPGCKVLIKGPVECRRGVLLLTESCAELLGGEVDELAVNTQAFLLATKLNLPLARDTNLDTTLSHPRNTNIPTPHTQMPPPISEPTFETFDQSSRPIARVTGIPAVTPASNFGDDDIDFDQLDAIEAQFSDARVKRSLDNVDTQKPEKKLKMDSMCRTVTSDFSNKNTSKIDLTSNTNTNAFNLNHTSNTNTNTFNMNHTSNTNTNTFNMNHTSKTNTNTFNMNHTSNTNTDAFNMKPTTSTNTNEDYQKDEDLCFEDEDYLREMETKFDEREQELSSNKTKVQLTVSSEPFVYLKQIEDLSKTQKAGRVFKVKGQILKLLSKLSVSKEGWTLKCTIVDGTGCLDVDFTSDVLAGLVGFTPAEMIQLKKQIGKPEIKAQIVSALEKAKTELQVLYCIIELTMLETPKISKLIPFEDFHVELLKTRLQTGC